MIKCDIGDVPGYRVIFRVHAKGVVLLAIRVLCNLLGLCYRMMNYNMTVSLYWDLRWKGEFQGDVIAKDCSDVRLTLDCMETKEEVCPFLICDKIVE